MSEKEQLLPGTVAEARVQRASKRDTSNRGEALAKVFLAVVFLSTIFYVHHQGS